MSKTTRRSLKAPTNLHIEEPTKTILGSKLCIFWVKCTIINTKGIRSCFSIKPSYSKIPKVFWNHLLWHCSSRMWFYFIVNNIFIHNYTPKGHFRVPPGLCFKTRGVGAQPLIWKSFFILMQIKLIFTRKVVHLALFWKWGFLELGSGLLSFGSLCVTLGKRQEVQRYFFARCSFVLFCFCFVFSILHMSVE